MNAPCLSRRQRPPFDALYVRVRPQIVVDGLVGIPADARGSEGAPPLHQRHGRPLDWNDTGEEISALAWVSVARGLGCT